MNEREICKYIDRLNKGNYKESVFTRSISKNVELAKVWGAEPKRTDTVVGLFHSNRFFFIKNEMNEYVGAIYDMGYDLHWYVVPKNRKKGYLSKALEEVILPYIFDERDVQEITIVKGSIGRKNYESSLRVAKKLGFKESLSKSNTFELKRDDLDWERVNIFESYNPISEDRMQELKKRAFFAFKTLYKISDEMEMAYVDNFELDELVKQIEKSTVIIDDLYWRGK